MPERLNDEALDAAADAMSEASYDATDGRDAAQRVVNAYLAKLGETHTIVPKTIAEATALRYRQWAHEMEVASRPVFASRLKKLEEAWAGAARGEDVVWPEWSA